MNLFNRLFQKLTESDEDIRKLRRETAKSPKDLNAKLRYFEALKRVGRGHEFINPRKQTIVKQNRSSVDLNASFNKNHDKADKIRNSPSKFTSDPDDPRYSINRRKEVIDRRLTNKADADYARVSNQPDIEIQSSRAIKLGRAASKILRLLPPGSERERLKRIQDRIARADFHADDVRLGRKRGTGFRELAREWASSGYPYVPAFKHPRWKLPPKVD